MQPVFPAFLHDHRHNVCLARTALDLRSVECLVVDDTLANVVAADQVGLITHQFRSAPVLATFRAAALLQLLVDAT